MQEVRSIHTGMELSRTEQDLHLNEVWFLRELCSWGIARDIAQQCWAAQEDEFGTKLKCAKEHGEIRLVLPGRASRSLTRRQVLSMDVAGPGGRPFRDRDYQTPEPLRGNRSFGGSSRSRARSRSRSQRYRRESPGSLGERGRSLGEALVRHAQASAREGPASAVASGGNGGIAAFHTSSSLPLGGPPSPAGFEPLKDSDDGVDEDDDEEDEQPGHKLSPEEAEAALIKTIGKCEAKIRDSPSEFEESAGLWHMQMVACNFIDALNEKELVH